MADGTLLGADPEASLLDNHSGDPKLGGRMMRRFLLLTVIVTAITVGHALDTQPANAGEVIYYAPPSYYMQPPLWYYPQYMVVDRAPIITYRYPRPVVYAPLTAVYARPVYRPRPLIVYQRPAYGYYYGW